MEKRETKGLMLKELEAQESGLLPDRVELRHRRRYRIFARNSNVAVNSFNAIGSFNQGSFN
jgi:hypothetical protein